MATIVSVHSFRGGTGKSNTCANLAVLMARRGRRVGVVDADIQSPGIHVLFGLRGDDITVSLNDYLWGRASITDTARKVYSAEGGGEVYLIPASMKTNEIVQVLRQGYDIRRLTEAFRELTETLSLDAMLIDTHPGLNEETLFSLAISTAVVMVLRPDQQDYEGTGVAVEVARSLEVPRLLLVVNKAPSTLDARALKERLEGTFHCTVAAVLPHSDEMMTLGSADVFANKYPNDPITRALDGVVEMLLAETDTGPDGTA
ncbi:MAG: MinD/ParA family protein [Chloroflexi bacterium]|nr:MinD/ParA family protein [Chloroflexota bacterium]